MSTKLGVKETKEVVLFFAAIMGAAGKVLEDKKVTIFDAYHLIDPMQKMAAAWDGVDLLKSELADLDAAELADLCDMFKKEFSLPQASLESSVEQAVQIAANIFAWYKDFSAVKA